MHSGGQAYQGLDQVRRSKVDQERGDQTKAAVAQPEQGTQAMAQDRPYRQGLGAGEIVAFLDKLVADGRLDSAIVAVAKLHMDEAMLAARPSH